MLHNAVRGSGLLEDGWYRRLWPAMFHINSTPAVKTKLSPIEIITGRRPTRDFDWFEEHMKTAAITPDQRERLQELWLIQAQVRMACEDAEDAAVKRYNARRAKGYWLDGLRQGDKVLLESKYANFPVTKATLDGQPLLTRKLTPRWFGPYKVEAFVGKSTVKLQLPIKSRMHPEFHFSRWKPWHGRDHDKSQRVEALKEYEDSKEEFDVKRILAHRENTNGMRYLVEWKGYAQEEASWESAENVQGAKELVQEYHEERNRRQDEQLTELANFDNGIGAVEYADLFDQAARGIFRGKVVLAISLPLAGTTIKLGGSSESTSARTHDQMQTSDLRCASKCRECENETSQCEIASVQ